MHSSPFWTISTATLKKRHVITISVLSCWLFGMRDEIEGCAECKFWPFISLPDSTDLGNILVRCARLFKTTWRVSLVTYISAMRATGAASLSGCRLQLPPHRGPRDIPPFPVIDIVGYCRHISAFLNSQGTTALLLVSWPTYSSIDERLQPQPHSWPHLDPPCYFDVSNSR